MIPLAFHGGTALRFLFATARYSEDLDFALEQARSQYDFRAFLRAIRSTFTAEGYTLDLKVSDRKTVHSAFVRFRGLPYELGLSPHQDEVLAVNLEVDTDPPAGAGLVTTVIRRHVPLQLHHHDRASLLAGKLRAVLQRPYLKGRDLYDLLWYLSDPDWPAPNLVLLNNALQQTGWDAESLTEDSWRRGRETTAPICFLGTSRRRRTALSGLECGRRPPDAGKPEARSRLVHSAKLAPGLHQPAAGVRDQAPARFRALRALISNPQESAPGLAQAGGFLYQLPIQPPNHRRTRTSIPSVPSNLPATLLLDQEVEPAGPAQVAAEKPHVHQGLAPSAPKPTREKTITPLASGYVAWNSAHVAPPRRKISSNSSSGIRA